MKYLAPEETLMNTLVTERVSADSNFAPNYEIKAYRADQMIHVLY